MGVGDAVRRRAAFLDRDGVINEAIVTAGKPAPPRSTAQLTVLPGVAEAIAQLHREGYLVLVVTNQPDVARGTTSKRVVEEINATLLRQLLLDGIYVCWHDDADHCSCRKPNPGLLLQAAREHDVDLRNSFMVGDRWRDISAGQRAGCRTIWIDRGYDEGAPTGASHTTDGLPAAVAWMLNQKGGDNEDGE